MQLPAALAAQLGDAPLVAETIGMSGDSVYRVDTTPACYLKISSGEELRREGVALRFLDAKVPVPGVLHFDTHDGLTYLLSTALPGRMACAPQWTAQPAQLALQLGWALRRLHTLPIAGCPLTRTLDTALELAARRVEQNLVDVDDWEDENSGRTPAQVLAQLYAQRPADEDLVFTHGDYCLPNVFLDGQGLTGFLDLGRCGVA
ncbi:MAG: aminoglycoside 3'-phosphotransferase, partial [Eubacteriales bacterium]|nr:aminoglycoside 3'-phosphotransferase [Eubacteriales bacterium]